MKIGLLWLISATILTGAWFIVLKKVGTSAAPLVVQTLNVTGTAVAVGILLIFRDERLAGSSWQWGAYWYYGILAGVLIGLANVLMFKAYETVPVSVVVPVLNLSCLIPILFGLFVLGEKVSLRQGLGIGLAVVALLLITYPKTERSGEVAESTAPAPPG